MKTTKQIDDMIQRFQVDPNPDGETISRILDILDALNQRQAALESRMKSTAEDVSHILNGVQPI